MVNMVNTFLNYILKQLQSIKEEIQNWTFCRSTITFLFILISWLIYSAGKISKEAEINILLVLLITFVAIQVFFEDGTIYSLVSLYKKYIKRQI